MHRIYKRRHEKIVSSFDNDDKIGYVNKNKTRNCQLDASKNYDAKFEKIFIRIQPELKQKFKSFCVENNMSMNAEIISLIEADIASY